MTSQGLRTHTCGELRASAVGAAVAVSGWVDHVREMGAALVFVDLRDRYGIIQVAFDDSVSDALRAEARGLKPESVIHVGGSVRARPEGQVNCERATGEVEVLAESLEVLSAAATPPFEQVAEKVSDELRLTYRYLDLRRAGPTRALKLRHDVLLALRKSLDAGGFTEIETPILTKATPEGARDYLVPSRVHPGKLYALPQSPQIFKQILMVAGQDKYFQICRCFRDEDLRADRQPEFTQLDLEMSFADEEVVLAVVSEVIAQAVAAARGEAPAMPMPRMTWHDAMARYGSDKPDTRFGVELSDVSALVKDSEFGVFKNCVAGGGVVRMLAAPGGSSAFSRKDIASLEGVAKEYGAKGLAWMKVGDGGVLESGSSKFLSETEAAALVAATGAAPGDLLLAVADSFGTSAAALGAVRLELGRRLDLVDRDRLDFLWVTEFPLFDRDEETGALSSAHHPFTAFEEQRPGQLEDDPTSVTSRAYDLVVNGIELGSGSVRIHDSDTQQRLFRTLGLSDAEIEDKFGFVISAFRYGAPPHAGFAVGLDRFVMVLAGEDSIREVIAFPKTAQAADLMVGAPSRVPAAQLAEAGVAVLEPAAAGKPATAGEPAAAGGSTDG